MEPKNHLLVARDLLESFIKNDVDEVDGVKKDKEKMRKLIRIYARNISTLATSKTIYQDQNNEGFLIDYKTFDSYVNALQRLFIIENVKAWSPQIRSSSTIRTFDKNQFVDPSIAFAALGLSVEKLKIDFNIFGFFIESDERYIQLLAFTESIFVRKIIYLFNTKQLHLNFIYDNIKIKIRHALKKRGVGLNRAEQDYLKLILTLSEQEEEPIIQISKIAERFSYSPQSVIEIIKKMADKQLVEYTPYKGVVLKPKGRNEALRMIRAHRLWEVFLSEKLGVSWENLHEEAEELEHVTSDDVANRLYHFLGKPKTCIHGNPIPSQDGRISKSAHISLWDAKPKDFFTLLQVDDDKDLLVYLNSIDMPLGSAIEVENKDDFGEIITIKMKNQTHVISKKIANSLMGTIT